MIKVVTRPGSGIPGLLDMAWSKRQHREHWNGVTCIRKHNDSAYIQALNGRTYQTCLFPGIPIQLTNSLSCARTAARYERHALEALDCKYDTTKRDHAGLHEEKGETIIERRCKGITKVTAK